MKHLEVFKFSGFQAFRFSSLVLCLLALFLLPLSVKGQTAFDYYQSFDNPADFPSGAVQPEGWTTEGTYPLSRYLAVDAGAQAYSGDYVYMALYSPDWNRSETSYTDGFALAGGREVKISFWYMTPGGNVPRRSNIQVAVGTERDFETMTLLGETPSDEKVSDWTLFEATFVPEADGTYYFAFRLGSTMSQAGFVFIDDVEIEGWQPEEGKPDEKDPDEGTKEPTAVTLSQLLVEPATYAGALCSIEGLRFVDFEEGDVFEEGMTYTVTDGEGHTVLLSLRLAEDLLDTAVPTGLFDLTCLVEVSGDETSGYEIVLVPRSAEDLTERAEVVVHATEPLSYFQSFDNVDGDYEGGYLPRGWERSGTVPFVTAYLDALPAVTGTYYMATPPSSVARDEIAYTPFFDLTAGRRYDISFYLYMPGVTYDGVTNPTNFALTVGTDQVASAQTDTVFATPRGSNYEEWTRFETSFVPTADGQYTFGFCIYSDYGYAGYVCIDDVMIFDETQPLKPSAAFTMKGWFDISTSDLAIFGNEPVQMVNLSTWGTDYEWTADNGAVPAYSEEVNPQFTFPEDGEYHVSLKAKNAAGERTTYRTFSVAHLDDTEKAGLVNYNPIDDRMLYTYEMVPTFDTDPMFDYVTGPNHYYTEFAERFEFPEQQEFTVWSMNIYLTAYSRMSDYTAEDRNHPFFISFYGDTDGVPDEGKLIHRKTSTIVDEFGNVGLGYERQKMWGFELDEPVTVNGKFYVAFRFGDDERQMPIESADSNITRSYVAYTVVEHKAGNTTIFVKPTAGPEGYPEEALGKWVRLDQFDASKAGIGTYLVLWGSSPTGIYAITTDGSVAFDARLDGRTLLVSGTESGEGVSLYDTAGRRMLTARGAERCTSLDLSALPTGTYVVSTAKGSRKFVVK